MGTKVTRLQYIAHLIEVILCFMTDLNFSSVVQHDECQKNPSGEAYQALQDIRIYRILKKKM